MGVSGLVLAMLKERWLTSLLHALILALGVAAATALLLVSSQTNQRLSRDAQGIDLVVGAKGSPLQLVLAAVFHADVPSGNVPFSLVDDLREDRRVEQAIPIGLGDSAGGYRIVGAPDALVALYGGAPAAGRLPAASMEAVLGADVAAALGLQVGQTFVGAHGLGEGGGGHDEHPFTVVGVLAPTGAVIDRLIVTPIESVWEVHGQHAHHDHDAEPGAKPGAAPAAAHADDHDHDHDHDHAHDHEHDKGREGAAAPAAASALPEEAPLEATAILLKLRSPIAAPTMRREINQQTAFLAARPADEAARLFALIGGGIEAFRALALVLIAVAALSVFATLFAALNDRRGDIALMRTMGATRGAVFGLLIGQGLAIAALGTLAGLALGHGLVEIVAQNSMQAAGFGLSGALFHPGEVWIALGGLAAGVLAALGPAALAYRWDIADLLADSR
jgi:putative ABC transport system permease protein